MKTLNALTGILVLVIGLLLCAATGLASPCELPDNGTGTVDMPPECPDGYRGALTIIDGLPAGSTIEGEAVLGDVMLAGRTPGGIFGGEIQVYDAFIYWQARGTGGLTGYERDLAIPVTCEVHTGPRTPGDPVQTFANEMVQLNGGFVSDPDFTELNIFAGSNYGLPSPGSCTLSRTPDGNFNVDSFFDITYQIEFAGAPGSILDGFIGLTTDTERFQAGGPYDGPSCLLPDNGTGTIDLPPDCPDGYVGRLMIIDGLPAGSTIEGEAVLREISLTTSGPGGGLGGEFQIFDALLCWDAAGTGDLRGYSHSLVIPVLCEMHTGPHNPGDPVQAFQCEIVSMQGTLYADPDFQTLEVIAGSDNGLPSPGQATLTRTPSGENFSVDSFFDLTYQITFNAAVGGMLEGLGGVTVDTKGYQAGGPWILADVGDPVVAAGGILRQNVPNPFNPMTVISYELPTGGTRVALDIFDIRGRHVCNLVEGMQTGGLKSVTWRGTDGSGERVSSGVYFYTLKTDDGTEVRKMAVIK